MKKILLINYPKQWIERLSCLSTLLPVLLGSFFLALISQIAFPLPFSPVPVTFQTFGVALLAITLGPRQAPLAVLAYLVEATLGFPVLAGGLSNPFWIFSAKAGYLLGFVFSSFLTATLIKKNQNVSLWKSWLILSTNEGSILIIGTLWLAAFMGLKMAFILGFLPFLPGAMIKITLAAGARHPVEWIKEKLS